jgi:hypothetical protein
MMIFQMHIKKLLRRSLFLTLLLLTTAGAGTGTILAQQLGIGFKAGMNITSHLNNFRFVSGDIDLDFTPGITSGFTGGFIYRQEISRKLRFQAEPTYTSLGAVYDDEFILRGFDFQTDSRTRLHYIQLPLLLQLTTTPPDRTVFGRERAETTYHITTGVFGGYLLDATFSGTNTGAPIGIEFEGSFSENVKGNYKELDGGVVLGGGLEYGSRRKIGLEVRAFLSVLDSGNRPEWNFSPQNMGITFGLYYIL